MSGQNLEKTEAAKFSGIYLILRTLLRVPAFIGRDEAAYHRCRSDEASGAAIGITGIASYAAAGVQMIVTGLLPDGHITADGTHDFTYASWFWLGAAVISFLLPLLNWRRPRKRG